MVTSTITAPPPISRPSATLTGTNPVGSRLELEGHLGDLREHFLQRLLVLGIDRNPAHRRELGNCCIHRFDGMRRVVPSSREQSQREAPRLLGDLAHAGRTKRSWAKCAAIRRMVRRWSYA